MDRDGFAQARAAEGVHVHRDGEEQIPLILRHRDVRAAARDWRTYSSAAPFRVPIPSEENVRRVRQIPIEFDPPEHTFFRKLIEPWFVRPQKPEYRARLAKLVDAAFMDARAAGEVDVVSDFALKLQSRALAVLLNVPQSDSELWISWGHSLYRDGDGAAKDRELEDYLRAQFGEARTAPERDDFFTLIARAEREGTPLEENERLGIANLVFAGGRDTIITIISEIIAHFAGCPEDAAPLAENPRLIPVAVEEFVRAVSPLAIIGRVCPAETQVHGETAKAGSRIGLCWASANHDASVFEEPSSLKLDRKPNPHMGFGSGVHACLGSAHARVLLAALIERIVRADVAMQIADAAPLVEDFNGCKRCLGFERLCVRFV